MSRFCSGCGCELQDDMKYCTNCGRETKVQQTEGEHKSAEAKTNPMKKAGLATADNEHSTIKVDTPLRAYVSSTINGVKQLLKEPKMLFKAILPSVIITVFWLLLSLLEAFGVNNAVIRTLSFFTYAQGGMFGGVLGAVGGIIGKALFAYVLCTVVNAVINKRKINPHHLFKGLKLTGTEALCCFISGAGVAMLLYLAMNITSSAQNSMIGIAGAIMVVMAAGQRGGLLMQLVCFIAKLLTRNRAPSASSVSRLFAGMATGFVIAVPLSFINATWLCPAVGTVLLIAGIVLSLFGGKANKATATIAMFLLCVMVFSSSTTAFAADKWGYDYLEHPEKYTCELGRTAVDEDDAHLSSGYVERVGAYSETVYIEEELQLRTLKYTFDSLETLTGLPAQNVTTYALEERGHVDYPDGSACMIQSEAGVCTRIARLVFLRIREEFLDTCGVV